MGMNFQEHLQSKQSPSPATRLQSQGRGSSLTAPNTLRQAVTQLIRCMVLSVGNYRVTSCTKTITIHIVW